MRRLIAPLALIAILGLAGAADAQTSRPAEPPRFMDGGEVYVIVHGYSTSYVWPGVLQAKLDRFLGKEGVAIVKSAVLGGTPIGKWIDPKTGEPTQRWTDVTTPVMEETAGRPSIVICQESLQYLYDEDPTVLIRDAMDAERIELGADGIENYVRLLQKEGAEMVLVAMHIYKYTMEPGVGNEFFALKAALNRGIPNFEAGPDVWTATRNGFPEAFSEDKLHPNDLGSEIMGQLWFEALLEREGLEVPEWSREQTRAAVKAAGGAG